MWSKQVYKIENIKKTTEPIMSINFVNIKLVIYETVVLERK